MKVRSPPGAVLWCVTMATRERARRANGDRVLAGTKHTPSRVVDKPPRPLGAGHPVEMLAAVTGSKITPFGARISTSQSLRMWATAVNFARDFSGPGAGTPAAKTHLSARCGAITGPPVQTLPIFTPPPTARRFEVVGAKICQVVFARYVTAGNPRKQPRPSRGAGDIEFNAQLPLVVCA